MNTAHTSVGGTVAGARGGFTLIEVLMGVLILALGLLGLGAVIPVIVREQRQASDATLGVSALNGAQAYLEARPELNRLTDPVRKDGLDPCKLGFGFWVLTTAWSTDGRWAMWKDTQEIDLKTGNFHIVDPSSGSARAVTISVADRLWPNRSSGGGVPQFVWDVVGRRIDGMNPKSDAGDADSVLDDHLQLVMFVRRLDPSIRVPKGKLLSDVLTEDWSSGDHRLPVAIDPTSGLPSQNGLGEYAKPIVLDKVLNWDSIRRDRVSLNGYSRSTANFKMASQPGQKIVDSLGNVYTVRGVASDDPDKILVDPPIPTQWPDSQKGQVGVVFTPQIPAAVRLIEWVPIDPPM